VKKMIKLTTASRVTSAVARASRLTVRTWSTPVLMATQRA
jgi:hypothetical protein